MADRDMCSILTKCQLGHLIPIFEREKVTPDLISNISGSDLNRLGVPGSGIMRLRVECSTYWQ